MRTLPDPGFAGDEGGADPVLAAALASYEADPDSGALWLRALAALQDTRVLVPVVATADPAAPGDKLTDMSAVLMQGRGGRRALLAFTGMPSLHRWDPDARPVPVSVPDAARAARHNGAQALVVDVAGPVLLVVEDDDLDALASGHHLLEVTAGQWAWAADSP